MRYGFSRLIPDYNMYGEGSSDGLGYLSELVVDGKGNGCWHAGS